MRYLLIATLLLVGCYGDDEASGDVSKKASMNRTIQQPIQKHSHLTLAQQAHQDPKKCAELRKQIALQKEKRREAYRRNMQQRKKQLAQIAETKE